MPRRRQHAPLRVLLNNRIVGHLTKAPGGAISFVYDQAWLDWEYALPRRVAERVGGRCHYRIEDMADNAVDALEKTAQALPADFPASIHESVSAGVLKRVRQLTVRE